MKYIYQISQEVVQNKVYKSSLLNLIVSLYRKHAPEEHLDIVSVYFLLKDSDSIAKILCDILERDEEPLIAYQIVFDLYDNQDDYFLQEVKSKLKVFTDERSISNGEKQRERLKKINSILEGDMQRTVESICLSQLNRGDTNIINNLKVKYLKLEIC